MKVRDSLLIALVAALVGTGVGFLAASGLRDERPVMASGPSAVRPDAPRPKPPVVDSDPVPRDDLRASERSIAAAPSEVVETRLPEAELERALDSVRAPEIPKATGKGTITGEVFDEWGAPVQGVLVVAGHVDANRATDPDAFGAPPPEETSLEEHLRESAERWAKGRGRSRRATSGADGRFELTGLFDGGTYSLSAYLAGHSVATEGSAWGLSAGQHVVFRAEPVHEIPVRLVFDGGTSPAEGVVAVRRGEDERLYTWKADAPHVRLTPGRVSLRGYGGEVRTRSSRGEVDSTHASEEQSIEVVEHEGVTVQLVLAPRIGIRGRVLDDSGGADRSSSVRLLALGSETDLDLEELAGSRRTSRVEGGRYSLLDLTAGPYAVGLTDRSGNLIVHERVSVPEGIVELDLTVPEPDPDRHLIVRAVGPSGRPVRDLSFNLVKRSGENTRGDTLHGQRAPDGSWWLRPKESYFEPWGQEASYTLTLRHGELGERSLPLSQGQREVDVTFEEPVTLIVTVHGYAGSSYVGSLQLAASRVGAEDAERRFLAPRQRGNGNISADGVARLENLAPGSWRIDLTLQSEDWQSRTVRSIDVVATAGEQHVSIDLPVLHELVVVAPKLADEGYLFLSGPSSNGERPGQSADLWGQVGSDGRAVFRGLAAGTYQLRSQNMYEGLEVTVPCAEVYLDEHAADCLRVAIGDLEGALYKAGLRAGDLIVSVDGKDIGSITNPYEALLGEGTAELSVVREGKSVAVTFERIANSGSWWTEMGGMLTPSTRR